MKASETEIAAIRKSAEEQAAVLYKKSWEEFEKYAEKQDAEQRKKMLALMMPSKEQMKEWEEGFAAQEKIEDIGVQAQREEARRRAARSGRMAELTAGQETPVAMSEAEKRERAERKEVAAAQQAYQTRLDLAVQLAGIEAERISKEENAAKRSVLAAQAQKDLFTELAQAQDQFEEKQAQIQQKRQQELQSQIDGLQKQAEKLIDVLFTKPTNFGKDLLSTIHSAVLKPVTETLGGAVANVLHPIIYGSDGHGGISGMLRGTSQDPVRVSTDMNTAATMQNSAVMAGLTAILAAGMGMAAPSRVRRSCRRSRRSRPVDFGSGAGIRVRRREHANDRRAWRSCSLRWTIDAPAAVRSSGFSPERRPILMNLPMSIPRRGGGMNPLATILVPSSQRDRRDCGNSYGLLASPAWSALRRRVYNSEAARLEPGRMERFRQQFWGGVQGVAKSPARRRAAGMMLAEDQRPVRITARHVGRRSRRYRWRRADRRAIGGPMGCRDRSGGRFHSPE